MLNKNNNGSAKILINHQLRIRRVELRVYYADISLKPSLNFTIINSILGFNTDSQYAIPIKIGKHIVDRHYANNIWIKFEPSMV